MKLTASIQSFATPEATEDMFYQAFRKCDLAAMSRVWADKGVVCVHPGSDVLIGRDAVMQSWAKILTNATVPKIIVNVLSKTIQDGMAVHLVEEYISPGGSRKSVASVVIATNIYQRGDYGWRIIEHHGTAPFTRKIKTEEIPNILQ
jgi:uncharacterized protein (TIGR02246 family)